MTLLRRQLTSITALRSRQESNPRPARTGTARRAWTKSTRTLAVVAGVRGCSRVTLGRPGNDDHSRGFASVSLLLFQK